MGMSHIGPLGVVAPPVPSAGTAEAQGDAGGSAQGERLRVQSLSPPTRGTGGEMIGRSLAEVQESGRRHQSSPGTC